MNPFLTVFGTFYCRCVYFIGLCSWNALHLYNFDYESDLKEKLNYLEFQDQNCQEIHRQRSLHSSHSSSMSISTPSTSRQQQSKIGYPQKLSNRLRCRYCSFHLKQTTTFFSCNNCKDPEGKPIIGLCTKIECFEKFHEEKISEKLFSV